MLMIDDSLLNDAAVIHNNMLNILLEWSLVRVASKTPTAHFEHIDRVLNTARNNQSWFEYLTNCKMSELYV